MSLVRVALVPSPVFKSNEGKETRYVDGLAVVLDTRPTLWLVDGTGQRRRLASRHLVHGDRWVSGGAVIAPPLVQGLEGDLCLHWPEKAEESHPGRGLWTLTGIYGEPTTFLHRYDAEPQTGACLRVGRWTPDPQGFELGQDEVMLAPRGFFLEHYLTRGHPARRRRASALAEDTMTTDDQLL